MGAHVATNVIRYWKGMNVTRVRWRRITRRNRCQDHLERNGYHAYRRDAIDTGPSDRREGVGGAANRAHLPVRQPGRERERRQFIRWVRTDSS